MDSSSSQVRVWAVLLSLTLVLLACGGSDGDAPEGTAAPSAGDTTASTAGTTDTTAIVPDASEDSLAGVSGCDLLTDDEIAAVTLSPVASKEEIGVQGCRWQTENGGEVSFIRYAGDFFSTDTCDGQLFFISGDEEEIPGLGDRAVWGSSGILVVCRADVVLKIDIDYSPSTTIEQDRDSAIAMGQSLLAQQDA